MGKKIGIYGGTFNPPHIGHLHVAETAQKAAGLDAVVFVPSGYSYMKSSEDMTSPFCRLMMTSMAVEKEEKFYVSDVEQRRPGPSYMIETVEELKEVYKDDSLFLIVGQDALEQMPSWYEYEKLISMIKLIVIPRGDSPVKVPPEMRESIYVICSESATVNLSSSQIRNMAKKGLPFSHLVPDGIYEYVIRHHLYRGKESNIV